MNTADIKDENFTTVVTDAELIDAPLWWHEQGLMQTATGYGRKLTTRYKVRFNGRLYRVYCTQLSNAGSLWFNAGGKRWWLQ